jgi:hypothetical protein
MRSKSTLVRLDVKSNYTTDKPDSERDSGLRDRNSNPGGGSAGVPAGCRVGILPTHSSLLERDAPATAAETAALPPPPRRFAFVASELLLGVLYSRYSCELIVLRAQ